MVYFFLSLSAAVLYGGYLVSAAKEHSVSEFQLHHSRLCPPQAYQWATGIESSSSERDLKGMEMMTARVEGVTSPQMESWRIPIRELKFGAVVGKGNVGEVYEGEHRGRVVAIKKLLGTWYKDSDMVQRFRDEILLMSTMHHPNVLVFLGAVLDPEAGNMCLVTELCRNGTLHSFLHSESPMDWRTRLRMCTDVARGMHYLHGRAGIIQRDLKSANLLLDDFLRVKIADFGLSRQMNTTVMETYCGTPATMAPEIVKQQPYSEKADVFSFAVIMWEILTRAEPYEGRSGLGLAMAVANEGIRPPVPAYCPVEWARLMTAAWAADADARPSFEHILDTLSSMEARVDAALRGVPLQAADAGDAVLARVARARGRDFEAMQANIARKQIRGPHQSLTSSDGDEEGWSGEESDLEEGGAAAPTAAHSPSTPARDAGDSKATSPRLAQEGSRGAPVGSAVSRGKRPPAAPPRPAQSQPTPVEQVGPDWAYAAQRPRRARRHTMARYRSYERDADSSGRPTPPPAPPAPSQAVVSSDSDG